FVTRVTNVRYPLGPAETAHPLLGARVPKALLGSAVSAAGTHPLHRARGVLFDLSADGNAAAAGVGKGWQDRVSVVTAGPVDGVDAAGLLVRPDGFVAWVSTDDDAVDGLTEALTTWFGTPG
ncbi:hypothetical protein AB4Z54_25480, partial [Streptomyces sp. MCAF7]